MKIKQAIQVIADKSIYAIIYFFSLTLVSFQYLLEHFTFFLIYNIIGYRKTIVIQNIVRAFPDMKYEEISSTVKNFYTRFVVYFIEILKNFTLSAEGLDKKVIIENLESIDNYIAEGQNVIVCTGHCGNWEMLNFMPYKLHHDMYAVYKPLKSVIINRLMVKLRTRFGMKLISNKSIARHILNKQSSPAAYLFLADQCPHIRDNKFRFKFLNQETYFFSGMEKLARISGSALLYLHITQTTERNYKIICTPMYSETRSLKEGEITQKYVDLLSENIKEDPAGWLWTHKRWKR